MIQPEPFPEHLMSCDPDFFIDKKLAEDRTGPELLRSGRRSPNTGAISAIPATVHAMCEDYRAAPGIDLEMDTKDFEAGTKITCPALILWGATGGVGRNSKPAPAEIWQRYAADIRGAKALPCGHYLSEEAPEETYQELRHFLPEEN